MFDVICPSCGCRVADATQHNEWHMNLANVARAVFFPGDTDEEWLARVNEATISLQVDQAMRGL